jgi:nucleotide-binding universal stress UspA family protein
MEKIIVVGVDFSDCSINALEHALTIANAAECDLRMVWVNKAKQEKSVALKSSEEAVADAHRAFEDMVEKYQPELKNKKIDFVIREGKVYSEIVGQAEDDDAFMLVVGTHGSSGFEEFWIGSNAQKIVSACHCPVITIRGGVDLERNLTKILLPIDSTLETRQKVPYTSALASYFDAELVVLAVYSTQVRTVRQRVDRYVAQVIEYLEEYEVNFSQASIEADNITNSTIDYAKQVDANLISIMTEQEKTTTNLWLGPYAQQMVNHSPIPVLSMHPKEYIRVLSR